MVGVVMPLARTGNGLAAIALNASEIVISRASVVLASNRPLPASSASPYTPAIRPGLPLYI